MIAYWILPAIYLGLLLWLVRGWLRSSTHYRIESWPSVSIIVVARNEAEHLPALLRDLKGLNYPARQLDIWLVDDHSEDGTANMANQSQNVNLLQLGDLKPPDDLVSYKKWGLTEAIQRCKGEIVLTTDADCRVQPDWVQKMVAPFADEAVHAAAGPVVIARSTGLLWRFQKQDMLGMQLITGGGLAYGWPILANGANLAFRKSTWEALGGYAYIDRQASGDDILLMLKINDRYPKSIRYCFDREAVVHTQPVHTWKAFWHQRLRWVSKVRKMGHPASRVLMGTGWLFSAGLLAAIISAALGAMDWTPVATMLMLKMVMEAVAISLAGKRLAQRVNWAWYPTVALLYIPYVTFAGILGNFIPYRWKGRTTR